MFCTRPCYRPTASGLNLQIFAENPDIMEKVLDDLKPKLGLAPVIEPEPEKPEKEVQEQS